MSYLGGIRPSRSSLVSARCVNPRLYFRNGVTKLRFRGRVVKYICRPGYSLFGDSVSTCNAGRWDRPVPVCAAPGCRLPTRELLPRGTVENVRGRGLMLRFRCRLGYTLRGGATAFCDGRAWNGSRPECVPSITDPDPSCDFEALDQCGWSSDLSGPIQFSRQHESEDDDVETIDNVTSSVAASGSSPSGHYMALENIGHRLALPGLDFPAKLVSPPYRPLRFRACFRFWYRLSCDLCTLQLLLWNSTDQTPLWSSYGPRKGGWASVELPSTVEYFQLVFAARTRHPGEKGVAIDDVRLGPECQDVPTAEPPPPTTTLLPDDNATELDSGDTWDSTTTYSSLSADKDDAADNSTTRLDPLPASTSNTSRTREPDRWATDKATAAIPLHEPTAQPTPFETASAVQSGSSSSTAQTPSTPFHIPTTIAARAGSSSSSATVAFMTIPVTSLPTSVPPATKEPVLTTHTPPSATTYSTSSSSHWRKIVTAATAFPTTLNLVTSSSHKASTANVSTMPRTSTASHASAARTSTTIGTVLKTQTPAPRWRQMTTAAWHRTTWPKVYPNVEGNTVGPDATSVKPSASKATTPLGSKATTPSLYTRIRIITPRTFTTVGAEAAKRTTHWLPPSTAAAHPLTRLYTAVNRTTAFSTATYTRRLSTAFATQGPTTKGVSVTEAATATPMTKPTKPRKKATELHTKLAKWTTRKPVKKPDAFTSLPPDVHSFSTFAHSSTSTTAQATTGRFQSKWSSSRSPKFVPTENNHFVKPVTKVSSGASHTSRPESKNDESNDVMLNDMSGMAVRQEKHSAAAPVSGSAWSIPALLIAAGILVTVLLVATALYRCRRRYRSSADDSEMKPLSKYADVDAGETSS